MPLVVHLTNEALAGWPLRLCQGVAANTHWDARCVVKRHEYRRTGLSFPADLVIGRDDSEIGRAFEAADLIAFHGEHTPDTFPEKWTDGSKARFSRAWRSIIRQNPKVVHFHTGPERWTIDWVRSEGISCTVSAWYHAEHADDGWVMLPHFLDTEAIRPVKREPLAGRRLRVAWSPSTILDLPGHPSDKGHKRTVPVLRSLSDIIEPIITTGKPVGVSLALRATCDVGIDELVSGSIHQTTIENAALGLVPVYHATNAQMRRIGGHALGVNVNGIANLRDALEHLALNEGPATIEALQERARFEAVERWDAKVIAPSYAHVYDAVLADRRAFASA